MEEEEEEEEEEEVEKGKDEEGEDNEDYYSGRDRDVGLPAELAGRTDSTRCRPGGHYRYFCGHERRWI